jgi:hypothetical protein
VVGAVEADAFAGAPGESFLNEFADHGDELRMIAWGASAGHLDTEFIAEVFGSVIEVVEDFHVIGEEADGRDDDVLISGGVEFTDEVEDIGFEPRIFGTSASALKDEFPAIAGYGESFGGESAGFGELFDVV